MKISGKYHLVWCKDTKSIIVDFEDETGRAVTESARSDLDGSDYDTKELKDAKIVTDNLVSIDEKELSKVEIVK